MSRRGWVDCTRCCSALRRISLRRVAMERSSTTNRRATSTEYFAVACSSSLLSDQLRPSVDPAKIVALMRLVRSIGDTVIGVMADPARRLPTRICNDGASVCDRDIDTDQGCRLPRIRRTADHRRAPSCATCARPAPGQSDRFGDLPRSLVKTACLITPVPVVSPRIWPNTVS